MDGPEDLSEDYATAPMREGFQPLDGSTVLWGRVAVLIGALFLAFILGRCTDGGVSQEELSKANAKLSASEEELARLKKRAASPAPSPTPPAVPSPAVSTSPSPAEVETSYTVKSGDTLRGISQKVYGSTAFATFIAQTNNVQADALKVGSKLRIPPKPTGTPAAGTTPSPSPSPSPTTTAKPAA